MGVRCGGWTWVSCRGRQGRRGWQRYLAGGEGPESNFELRGLCGDSDIYGHQALHDALMDFSVCWSEGLDVLTEDAGAIGQALTNAANAYRGIDDTTARTLGGDPGEGAVDGA